MMQKYCLLKPILPPKVKYVDNMWIPDSDFYWKWGREGAGGGKTGEGSRE